MSDCVSLCHDVEIVGITLLKRASLDTWRMNSSHTSTLGNPLGMQKHPLMIGWTTITMNDTNGIWQNYPRQNTFNTALPVFTHYKQTSSYMVFSIYELNDFTYVSKIKVRWLWVRVLDKGSNLKASPSRLTLINFGKPSRSLITQKTVSYCKRISKDPSLNIW